MREQIDRSEVLADLAVETLDALARISQSADAWLRNGAPIDVTNVLPHNQMTMEKVLGHLQRKHSEMREAQLKLREEPAIARVVVADEDDKRTTLYVTRASSGGQFGVTLCSYLAPMGRLASFPVGDGTEIRLPKGNVWFDVIERAIYRPFEDASGWDSQDTVVHTEDFGPLTVASLRALVEKVADSADELAELDRLLEEEAAVNNVQEGLKRRMLTAMALRDQPLLDQFQDRIFRMPLDSRLVILGPPGTGKTTTLIRRLKQKIDVAFLEPEEQSLIEADGSSSVPHPHSWLMFTPTELLKQYVQEAFAREGVAAPNSRIYTWDDYRPELARNRLPILKSASGGTLVLNKQAQALQPGTIGEQAAWFDDFDAFQKGGFLAQLARDADAVAQANDPGHAALGIRLVELLSSAADRSVPATLFAIGGFDERLKNLAAEIRLKAQDQFRRLLAEQLSKDRSLLDALFGFVETLGTEGDDEEEVEADLDVEDEDEPVARGDRAIAQSAFLRAVRAKAVSEARKRSVGRASRNGKVLEWLGQRGLELPPLAAIGEALIVQRAARRLTRAPRDFVRAVPTRYRAFRRERSSDGLWYISGALPTGEITPLETDIVLLSTLRNARLLLLDRPLMRQIGGNLPTILETIRDLQRNQILVDEATDFSPVQLGCMAALANPKIDAFFACGDFNQRLTHWGSRSRNQFLWVSSGIKVEPITVTYRQSRRLNQLARALASADQESALASLPEHMDNEGVPPALGVNLRGDDLVQWVAARIFEIEDFTGKLPSIAVLVNNGEQLPDLANQLDQVLGARNIKAVACPGGQVMGRDNDVRVFEVEHIKGLEFEAVFFIDIDSLQASEPELFEKYLYVGATRAATYLGMTCSGRSIPRALMPIEHLFVPAW